MNGGLERLKIETSLIDERFASVMGECVILEGIGAPSMFKTIRSVVVLSRMLPTSKFLDFICEESDSMYVYLQLHKKGEGRG